MPGYALCADLLAPEGCGEIIGGSQRISDYDEFLAAIKKHNLPVEFFGLVLRFEEVRRCASWMIWVLTRKNRALVVWTTSHP